MSKKTGKETLLENKQEYTALLAILSRMKTMMNMVFTYPVPEVLIAFTLAGYISIHLASKEGKLDTDLPEMLKFAGEHSEEIIDISRQIMNDFAMNSMLAVDKDMDESTH